MPCNNQSITFQISTIDPLGKHHDTGKQVVVDADKVRKIYSLAHNHYVGPIIEDYIAPVLLGTIYNFDGKYVPGYKFKWDDTYTKKEGKVWYGGIAEWYLKRIN